MEKTYKLIFIYPDGHIEEVDEIFTVGKDALEYGNSLLAQVQNTEGVINRGVARDIFDEVKKIEPYFMIIEIKGKKQHLVYDSKGR